MSELHPPPRNIFAMLLVSLIVAVLALVLFVLPAEYGRDPTGFGKAIGIAGMSGYSVNALTAEQSTYAEDAVEFPLAPFESIEYKYHLAAGQSMLFSWTAEAEVVFDFHSEEEGSDPDDAVSFEIGRASSGHGTYVAPYTGIHGWFWENRGEVEVLVKLKTRGFYSSSTVYSRSGEFTKSL